MKPRKKKIMKLMVAIVMMLIGQLTVAQELRSNRDSFDSMKHKLRPGTLSTASVGFGKRAHNPYSMINNKPKYLIILSPVQDSYKRIPIFWLPRHPRRYSESQENKSRINTRSTTVPSRVLKTMQIIMIL